MFTSCVLSIDGCVASGYTVMRGGYTMSIYLDDDWVDTQRRKIDSISVNAVLLIFFHFSNVFGGIKLKQEHGIFDFIWLVMFVYHHVRYGSPSTTRLISKVFFYTDYFSESCTEIVNVKPDNPYRDHGQHELVLRDERQKFGTLRRHI
jgi:hypothetical protein